MINVNIQTYLLAPFTLVRLLPTMDTLVSLKVVALDKPHITHVTSKWLLSYKSTKIHSQCINFSVLHQQTACNFSLTN